MNTISLYIYLANMFDNLSSVLEFLAVILAILCTIGLIPLVILHGINDPDEADLRRGFRKGYFAALGILFVAGGLFVVVPNKPTILMIAASEATQQVASTPQGQEILNRLNSLLDKKLKELEK